MTSLRVRELRSMQDNRAIHTDQHGPFILLPLLIVRHPSPRTAATPNRLGVPQKPTCSFMMTPRRPLREAIMAIVSLEFSSHSTLITRHINIVASVNIGSYPRHRPTEYKERRHQNLHRTPPCQTPTRAKTPQHTMSRGEIFEHSGSPLPRGEETPPISHHCPC